MAYKTASKNLQKSKSGTWSRHSKSDRLDFSAPLLDVFHQIYGLTVTCQHCSKTTDITLETICKKFELDTEFRKIVGYFRNRTKCSNKVCTEINGFKGIKNDIRVLRKYE